MFRWFPGIVPKAIQSVTKSSFQITLEKVKMSASKLNSI